MRSLSSYSPMPEKAFAPRMAEPNTRIMSIYVTELHQSSCSPNLSMAGATHMLKSIAPERTGQERSNGCLILSTHQLYRVITQTQSAPTSTHLLIELFFSCFPGHLGTSSKFPPQFVLQKYLLGDLYKGFLLFL